MNSNLRRRNAVAGLDENENSSSIAIRRLGAIYAAILLGVYTIFSAPFVFYAFAPYGMRVGLELVILVSMLIFISVRTVSIVTLQCILIWLVIVTMTLLTSQTSYETVIRTSIGWVYFLLLIAATGSSSRLIGIIVKGWFWIWLYVSCTVVAGFIFYQLELVEFKLLDFSEISASAPYTYYNNMIFGNVFDAAYYGNHLSRMCWYLFEPGQLGFFLGINIIIAGSVYASHKYKSLFMGLNFVAGCLTFSTTFVMFFLGLFIYRLLSMFFDAYRSVIFVLFSAVVILVVHFLLTNDLLNYSSASDRMLRMGIAWDIASNNSIASLLFGNGIGISGVVADRGISSGVINIFIERGLLVLVFISYFIYRYAKSNKMLLIYIAFFSLVVEVVWYPAFLIVLYLEYATREGGVRVPQN